MVLLEKRAAESIWRHKSSPHRPVMRRQLLYGTAAVKERHLIKMFFEKSQRELLFLALSSCCLHFDSSHLNRNWPQTSAATQWHHWWRLCRAVLRFLKHCTASLAYILRQGSSKAIQRWLLRETANGRDRSGSYLLFYEWFWFVWTSKWVSQTHDTALVKEAALPTATITKIQQANTEAAPINKLHCRSEANVYILEWEAGWKLNVRTLSRVQTNACDVPSCAIGDGDLSRCPGASYSQTAPHVADHK